VAIIKKNFKYCDITMAPFQLFNLYFIYTKGYYLQFIRRKPTIYLIIALILTANSITMP